MSNAMQSFFYGLAAIVFAVAIIALCSGVKAAIKKLLKGEQNHDCLLYTSDIRYQLQILKLIRQLNREYGITIVMVLHDINQSLYYSDEIVAMKDGRMIARGLPKEIISGELVQEVYDVNLDIRTVDGKPFVIPV